LEGEALGGDAGHGDGGDRGGIPAELGGAFEGGLGSVDCGTDAGRLEVVVWVVAGGGGGDVLGGGCSVGFDGGSGCCFRHVGGFVVGLSVAFWVGMGGVGTGAGVSAGGLRVAVGLAGRV
jgi:hypothetical protein